LYRRLGGPQGRSGWIRKISPPTGTLRPIASRYIDCAIPAHTTTTTTTTTTIIIIIIIVIKYVSNIPGNHEVKELQKTAVLGTARILRKVLT